MDHAWHNRITDRCTPNLQDLRLEVLEDDEYALRDACDWADEVRTVFGSVVVHRATDYVPEQYVGHIGGLLSLPQVPMREHAKQLIWEAQQRANQVAMSVSLQKFQNQIDAFIAEMKAPESVPAFATAYGIADVLPDIESLTKEIFPGPVSMSLGRHPASGSAFLQITVSFRKNADVRECVRRSRQQVGGGFTSGRAHVAHGS
jgi:hypothetical protein